jgi:DNA-binding NarL/FixJ family response regulator
LAVFVGGFDARAATSVAPGLSVDLLVRLVEKSLVVTAAGPSGHSRYRLLDSVYEYARELLFAAGELEAARERHLHYFAQFAEASPWRDRPLTVSPQLVNELHEDYENVRAAVEWAASSNPCAARSLLAGMTDVFLLFGQADGRRLAGLLLERCRIPDRERAQLEIAAGVLALMVADPEGAASSLAEASRLSIELGERGLEGWAGFFRGLAATLSGAVEPAREHLEASRALHQRLGMPAGWAVATAALGLTYLMTGEPGRARELVEEALGVNVAENYGWGQGQCHLYLGIIIDSTATEPALATLHYRQAVEHLRLFRGGPLLPQALVGQAGLLARRDPARALRVAAAAYDLRERTAGGAFPPFFRALAERARTAAETAVGADVARIWKEGLQLSPDEAIALAFGTDRPRRRGVAGLSEREVEVARLVADGLSNKAIAAKLQLSVRTVESHVRHALAKARLENRTQLATWARERIQ